MMSLTINHYVNGTISFVNICKKKHTACMKTRDYFVHNVLCRFHIPMDVDVLGGCYVRVYCKIRDM